MAIYIECSESKCAQFSRVKALRRVAWHQEVTMAQKHKKPVKSGVKKSVGQRRALDEDLPGREDLSRDDQETDFEITGRESLVKRNVKRDPRL
jgi:hypothetical protein